MSAVAWSCGDTGGAVIIATPFAQFLVDPAVACSGWNRRGRRLPAYFETRSIWLRWRDRPMARRALIPSSCVPPTNRTGPPLRVTLRLAFSGHTSPNAIQSSSRRPRRSSVPSPLPGEKNRQLLHPSIYPSIDLSVDPSIHISISAIPTFLISSMARL